ncbi:uncharacterized protein LOC106162411 [Lingula anatina]|uniref:Uncharacterized protein LOC106162411 n=1 Tax=Lingula anatina TaxID=7574 RepID=A0A1S3IAG6_LINAN|nr:uncharacterized protein LOC106162411 [Lingula anatina]|eukprot:XP_013395158.1 uncharacterized protein LOC106162411 [Lingula anatina]
MMKLVIVAVLVCAVAATYKDFPYYGRYAYGRPVRYAPIAGRPEDYLASCAGVIYNTNTQDCCGGYVYNRATQDCCAGSLIIIKPAQCPGVPLPPVDPIYAPGYGKKY